MGCTCCPALVAMRKEADKLWPNRDKASDGCCGDSAHAARKSDHNPDGDGMATAYDLDHDDTDGFDGFHWSEVLRLRRDPRVKYVIFFGRMFSSYTTPQRKAWEWGPYTGPNAHRSHMHVSVLQEQKRVIAPWFFDDEEVDMFGDQDRDRLTRLEGMVDRIDDIVSRLDQNADARMDAINGHTTKEAGKVVAAAKELRDNAVRAVERIVAALKPTG